MNFSKLILLPVIFLLFSCNTDKLDLKEEEPMVEEDCRYKFEANIADIYGAWEPRQIISLKYGDTINYEIGEGHTGFMLNDHYADALELRPDSALALYYLEHGRFCASRTDGNWFINNDTIFISRPLVDTTKLPVIALSKTELVIEDIINFRLSKATYRKIN